MYKTALLFLWSGASLVFAQANNVAVTTGQYNTARTSSTWNEQVLNTSDVNVNQFGKLMSLNVDGWVFAQPLYVRGVSINGVVRNVLYVATMHNSVYAFDADHPGTAPLWTVNFGASVTAPTANGCPSASFTGPELGILSTPVIDQRTNTLYAVSASPSGAGFVHLLHAIDLSTHLDKFGSPKQIQASVPGTGYDARSGNVTLSTASADVQRTALLLANGTVYAAFGSCGPDTDPWHGWMLGYNAATLAQTFAFNSTPNGGQGGIWQSGRGPVADTSGDIYFNTGNATAFTQADSSVTTGSSTGDANNQNFAERFLRLTGTGQFMASYPPANYSSLNNNDLDFSSSGPLLIPGTTLLVTGGKDGVIYVFDSNNMATPAQSFQATGAGTCAYSEDGCDQIHDLAFWNNTLYVWGTNDNLRAYAFNRATSRFNPSPASQNPTYKTGYHSATLAVSGNGAQTGTGIVWAVTPNSILHAFDASNVASELWNSSFNSGRDSLPSAPRFTEATVANGKVYVATHSNQVAVYGLLSDFTLSTATPSVAALQGGPAIVDLTVDPIGSNGTVALAVTSGLPAGATASFSPASVTGAGTSVLTINTSASTPTGTYNLIVSGTMPGEVRTASVSLVVTTTDRIPPGWTCCTYSYNGPSTVMHFSAWDTQSGLKSIRAVQVVNSTVSIPSFEKGTHATVNFSATESGWSSYVKFQLVDVAGNVSYINPCELVASRHPGKPVPFTVKNLSPAESYVTIINGSPGVKNLRFSVNVGAHADIIEVAGLGDGETRQLSVKSLLNASGDAVTITVLGKPEGTAHIIFAPGPMSPAR